MGSNAHKLYIFVINLLYITIFDIFLNASFWSCHISHCLSICLANLYINYMLNMNLSHTSKEREALLWNGFFVLKQQLASSLVHTKRLPALKGWKLFSLSFHFFWLIQSQTLETSAFGLNCCQHKFSFSRSNCAFFFLFCPFSGRFVVKTHC